MATLVDFGIIYALVAMLGLGLSNSFAPVPSKKIGVEKTVFYRGIFVCLLLLMTFMFFIDSASLSPLHIMIALGISILGFASIVLFYKALKIGKVGIVSPIANSSVVFTILFSVIFFKENLSLPQFFSMILIITGIVLVSIDFNELTNPRLYSTGILFALITCILWGIVFFLCKIPTNVLGPFLTSFLMEFGILILSAIRLFFHGSYSVKGSLFHTFLVGFTGAIGILFFNIGITQANVSIVAAITFANPLVPVVYGRLVYKERLNLKQAISVAMIILGIISVSYF